MTEQLPEPLVPAEVDLTGMPFMPLDTQRLLDSELWITGSGDECKAAVSLWCKAWQQKPAASLPDNDQLLADYSKAGARWKKVKAKALHGFVKCSDGRLYHPVVAEKAIEAWEKRLGYQARTKAANERRKEIAEDRERQRNAQRNNDADIARDDQRYVAREPNVTSSKGQGQIERKKEAPLPPLTQTNGHAANGALPPGSPSSESEIEKEAKSFNFAFFKLREIEFGGPPAPSSYPAKDLSVARGWIERGVEFYPFRELLEQQMRRMAKANKPPPSNLWFFNRSVDEAIASDWQGYRE